MSGNDYPPCESPTVDGVCLAALQKDYRGGKKYETHFGFANHVWQCILATSKPFSTILAIFESSESQLSNDTTQRFIFCLVVAWHFLKVLCFFRAHSEIGVSDQRFPWWICPSGASCQRYMLVDNGGRSTQRVSMVSFSSVYDRTTCKWPVCARASSNSL